MFDTVILDWSGTLVDDLDAVLQGTNQVFVDRGIPALSRDEFRLKFDLPVETFYDAHLPGVPFEEIDRSFFKGFRQALHHVTPFPATVPFLQDAVRLGVSLQILTTLDCENADRMVGEYGWSRYFDAVHAGIANKIPYLVRLVREGGLDPDRTVFVGDLPHDIEAGRAAGVRTCAVLSGYGTRDRLTALSPDFLVPDVSGVGDLLRSGGNGDDRG
jgi:phosphoglycolate phosphatase-like HAD superfamily hydrolase